MISVITEDEAVWFSFLTLNRVLAFVSAAFQLAQADLHLVLHTPLRATPGVVCAQKELRSQFYSHGWILNCVECLRMAKNGFSVGSVCGYSILIWGSKR